MPALVGIYIATWLAGVFTMEIVIGDHSTSLPSLIETYPASRLRVLSGLVSAWAVIAVLITASALVILAIRGLQPISMAGAGLLLLFQVTILSTTTMVSLYIPQWQAVPLSLLLLLVGIGASTPTHESVESAIPRLWLPLFDQVPVPENGLFLDALVHAAGWILSAVLIWFILPMKSRRA